MENQERQVIVLPGHGQQDVFKVADLLANKYVEELFASDGRLYRMQAGDMTPLTIPALGDLVRQTFVTVRPICRSGVWAVSRSDIHFDRTMLVDISNALLVRVAAAPSQITQTMSHALQQNIRDRAATGEPRPALAKAYQVSLDAINQIVARP